MIDKSWLNSGKPRRKSKFINQSLGLNEEFVGIYEAARQAKNSFRHNTFHYIFYDDSGKEIIFDSKNPNIADIFSTIPFKSRVSIKKVPKPGGYRFDVKLINTLKDEEALADAAREYKNKEKDKREENIRDERLDENET